MKYIFEFDGDIGTEGTIYYQVVDEKGKIEPFEPNKYDYDKVYDEAYQNGMNDAWEVARKIAHGTCWNEVLEKTGKVCAADVLDTYTASEAIDKIREHEQNCDLKIGDEILFDGNVKGVVYNISERVYCFTENATVECFLRSEIKKTGRYFPEIVEILKKIREG